MVSNKLYFHYNACQIARKFIDLSNYTHQRIHWWILACCILLCIFACNYFSILRNICTFCNLIMYVNTRAWNDLQSYGFLSIKTIPIKRDHHKGEWIYGKFMDTILFPIRASLHNLNLWILGKGIFFFLNPISWEKSISMFVYFVFQRSIKLTLTGIFIAIRF